MKRDWHGYQHFPRQGGMLVAGNHLSYADWPAMALFVHEAGRYPAFMIKSSAFDVKLIGAAPARLGQLPVRRGEADAANVLKVAEQALADGECVIIYPEGTATRDPEQWPMVAKTGVARLALATGVPVIPVAQWGAQDILPYGDDQAAPVAAQAVRMLAGPPVDLTEFEGKPFTRDVLRGATNAIMADVATLLAELRGGQPPAEPYHPAVARRAARQAARDRTAVRAGAGATAGTAADSQPAPTRAPTRVRRRRRESGGHGRRHVGHHVRPGALRRGYPGHALGPAARRWWRRSTTRHENPDYLPGITLPPGLTATRRPGPRAARRGPRRAGRARPDAAPSSAKPGSDLLPADAAFVSLMKGIELGTHDRMSQVIAEVTGAGPERIAVVSGPNLAREIAERQDRRDGRRQRRRHAGQAAAAGMPHAVLPAVHQPGRDRLRARRRGQERDRAGRSGSRSAWAAGTTPGPR